MRIAIIGGGIAAFSAAITLRKLSADAEITIFSREKVPPYRRPALSRMAASEVSDTQFYLKPESFYRENNIRLELGRTVLAVDTAKKTLSLDSGTEAAYDKLILCTGAHCFIPPVCGGNLDGIMSLREYADLVELRRRLDGGIKNAVVIGGGLLGLELAESLLQRGCRVTVIEGCPTLLPRNLDEETGKVVLDMLAEVPDLSMRFGNTVDSVSGAEGKVAAVLIAGESIPAELVMVSAGARSNTAEAAAAGISCNRGIITDRFMKTSVPDIFAAGDCAEVEGASYGLYEPARAMGETAAKNIMGEESAFVSQSFPARLMVFGVKIFSAGVFSGTRSEVTHDPEAGNFKKLFFDSKDRLTGVILIGDLKESAKLQALLTAQE